MIADRFLRTVRGFAVAVAAMSVLAAAATAAGPAAAGMKSRDAGLALREVRAKAEKYIDYWSAISLTPAQAQIKTKALERIPAPMLTGESTPVYLAILWH